MNTAEDNDKRHQSQPNGNIFSRHFKRLADGIAESVALNDLVRESKAIDNEYSKKNSHPGATQTILHIISRSTEETIFSFPLKELCKSCFHEGRRRSQQCHHPHPEHRTGSTYEDSTCHSSQITRPDSRREADGKGLEG